MTSKRFQTTVVLIVSIGLANLQAQEAVITSGGEGSGSGGTVSYSVGQTAYTVNTGTSGSVIQGVQQPYEISVVAGLEVIDGIDLELTVYPNPTTNLLTLSVKHYDSEDLSYHLFDITGKLLGTKKLEGSTNTIAVEHLVPAIYFLKIMDKENVIKTFKIIKN